MAFGNRLRLWLLLPCIGLLWALAVYSPAWADEQVYVVKPNDTLNQIAQAHGLKSNELIAYNRLKHPDDLSVGQKILIPPKPGIRTKYQVRNGDSLGSIARNHGVSVQDLVSFNNISNPDALTVGQTLLIPGVPALPRSAPVTEPQLKKVLDGIPVKKGKWKYIVIHHSATLKGNAKGMDQYHRKERHMENGLAYHFVIGNGRGAGDGAIEIGNRWRRQIKGGHLASEALNEKSIGICLVGDFNKQKPTSRQMQSLCGLIEYLENRCDLSLSAVKLHKQINTKPTQCPGRHFPSQDLMARLSE